MKSHPCRTLSANQIKILFHSLTFWQWYVAFCLQGNLLLGQPSRSESSPHRKPSPANPTAHTHLNNTSDARPRYTQSAYLWQVWVLSLQGLYGSHTCGQSRENTEWFMIVAQSEGGGVNIDIQREKLVPACFRGLPAVRGRTAGCLYSGEDRACSSTPGLCLHTLWHTHPPLHTAEIERSTMFSISNTECKYEGVTGGFFFFVLFFTMDQTTLYLFLFEMVIMSD